jgi:Spy/CpxP family protein refolding chaperone
MKSNTTYAVLLAALVGVTGAAIAAQADTASTASTASTATAPATTTPKARHWGHGRGGLLVGALLRATHQLNLTAAQQSSIKSILASARSARSSSAQNAPDITVLGNPGHPDYATAVQSAKSLASTRLDRQSALATQIYDVLTTEQKTQLPNVLAAMKAKAAQRRAAWQQLHNTAGASGG